MKSNSPIPGGETVAFEDNPGTAFLSGQPTLETRGEAGVIHRLIHRDSAPLSCAQERLWLLDQLEPGSPAYHQVLALRLIGVLDEAAVRKSLQAIIDRHGILRTFFPIRDGQPAQVISSSAALDLRIVDLSQSGPAENLSRARTLASEESFRPFDLARGPIFRATLMRLREHDHVLLLCIHLIAFDVNSSQILIHEFKEHYCGLCAGTLTVLPDIPIQYGDFANWQRQCLDSELCKSELRYWQRQLNGCTPLDLPLDRFPPSVASCRGGSIEVVLANPLADSLKELGQSENATLFMVLLGAFQVLLSRCTGSEDIVVTSQADGRKRVGTEKLIGLFVNTCALRTDTSCNPTFRELLGRVRETCLEAFNNQDLPFEPLLQILRPQHDSNTSPFFQAMYKFETPSWERMEIPGLRVEEFRFEAPVTPYALSLEVRTTEQGVAAKFVYSSDLFDRSTIERIAGHFKTLLEAIVADPNGHIGLLPLLTPAERHQILEDWNRTGVDYPRDATLPKLFENQALQRPEAVALTLGEQHLTYEALNRRANLLAHHLRGLGVGLATRVGLLADRSLEMVVGILAILKAGGACVPLDPEYPKERLAFMLEDSGIHVILTHERLKRILPHLDLNFLFLDRLEDLDSGDKISDPFVEAKSDEVAYVLYTSGSTGTPKGVEVLHRGVVRLVCGPDYIRFGPDEVFLHCSSISFDASTFELWGALLHGGRCVLFPHRVPDLGQLRAVIKREKVTTLWFTPSLFSIVLDQAPDALLPVSQLVVGGEALSVSDICRAMTLLPNAQFVNGYGPTESSTFACCYRIPKDQSPLAGSIPIGRPIANTLAYILDRHLQPVPIGVPGELWIGGDGLARGYLNRPDITSQKFIPNPFEKQPGARLYKSGDMCRYLPDGKIEYLGRLDDQVKIRGFRIELGEIEAALAEHPSVSAAAVAVREEAPNGKYLIAYVVPQPSGPAPRWKDLRDFLKEKLPHYMVPTDFFVVKTLPLTPTGKLDRKALPVMNRSRQEDRQFVPPRDMQEFQLARIWEEVLNVRPIGIEHDFFELGGHSLLAVRMMDRIEDAYGKRLPLTTLFGDATIRHLADCLRTDGLLDVKSAVTLVQPGSSRLPFFFLHGDGWGGLYCRKLARLMGPDQPFYAWMPDGFDGKPLAPSVEMMAEENIRKLVDLQPLGPYLLGGFCNGGVVAYEMARRMEQKGLKVGVVILIDAQVPPYSGWLKALCRAAGVLARLKLKSEVRLYSRLLNYWTRIHGAYQQGIKILLTLFVQTVMRKFKLLFGTPHEKLGTQYSATGDAMVGPDYSQLERILSDYQPQTFQGPVVLLRTKSLNEDYPRDRTAGWGKLVSHLEIHDLPGDHTTCHTEDIGRVAEFIGSSLGAFHAGDKREPA